MNPSQRTGPGPNRRRTVASAARCAAALVLLVAGCGPRTGGGGARLGRSVAPSDEDLRGIELVPLDARPDGPAATSYGGKLSHPLTPIEAEIATSLGGLPLTHEPALSRMARELARLSPHQVNVPAGLVDGLMSWAGLADPQPRLVVVQFEGDRAGCDRRPAPGCRDAIDSLVQQVEATMPDADALFFGVGVVTLGQGRTRMMVAVLERSVLLQPVPRAVSAEGQIDVKGVLVGARTRPSVEMVGPDGAWARQPTSVSVDGSFGARVHCSGVGAHQIEVLAEGRHGPEVAANFPVWCGQTPPTKISVVVEKVAPDVTGDQIARANFIYLNRERERRGLPALAWDDEAADVALAHSQDMANNGFVGHRSETTGDVTARFARAKVPGVVIRENVARGYGPKGIHDSLMSSPGHRVNMLATDVTHVGVGAVVGPADTEIPGAPRPVFATQNFYRRAGATAPADDAALPETLEKKIDEARAAAGLPPVQWDEKLGDIAQKYAPGLAAGRRPPKSFETEVFALGYAAIDTHQLSSPDFDTLASADLFRAPALAAGLGVVRTKKGGAVQFVAVVLIGER
mgnify:CR=1 FL=1